MKVGSLFSGIGAGDLGLERAGFEIAWQCEIDPYCQKVLAHHWPEVPQLGDITRLSFHNLGCGLGSEALQVCTCQESDMGETVAVRAEQETILNGQAPAFTLGPKVMSVNVGSGPATTHASVTEPAAQSESPTVLVCVRTAPIDDVRLSAIPAATDVPLVALHERHPGVVPPGKRLPHLNTAATSAIVHTDNYTTFSIIAPALICAGTPCQDLSVAGKRAGLEGERSGLFREYVRIITEIRKATNGRSPALALWENVPGAFSSQSGRDFATVLGLLANAGALDIAWRVLDSQWFGVPQRRRRIFLVADFGGERSAEILFEPESCGGNPPAGREAREDVAYALSASVRKTGDGHGNAWNSTYIPEVVAHSLRAEGFDASEEGMGRGTPLVAATLTPGHEAKHSYAGDGGTINVIAEGTTVRRLTPTECERLQGLPDGWTDLGDTADGPRYKALGNAMTMPVIEYLGLRIQEYCS